MIPETTEQTQLRWKKDFYLWKDPYGLDDKNPFRNDKEFDGDKVMEDVVRCYLEVIIW